MRWNGKAPATAERFGALVLCHVVGAGEDLNPVDWQHRERVDRHALIEHREVDVRPGGATGEASAADLVALLDGVTLLHFDVREMRVQRRVAARVLDDDVQAVAAARIAAYERNDTASHGAYWLAGVDGDIDRLVRWLEHGRDAARIDRPDKLAQRARRRRGRRQPGLRRPGYAHSGGAVRGGGGGHRRAGGHGDERRRA